jgi:hypothetical protein
MFGLTRIDGELYDHCADPAALSKFVVAVRELFQPQPSDTPLPGDRTIMLATGPEGAGTHVSLDVGMQLNREDSGVFVGLTEADVPLSVHFRRSMVDCQRTTGAECDETNAALPFVMFEQKRCIANALLAEAQEIWFVERRLPKKPGNESAAAEIAAHARPCCNVPVQLYDTMPTRDIFDADPRGAENMVQTLAVVRDTSLSCCSVALSHN